MTIQFLSYEATCEEDEGEDLNCDGFIGIDRDDDGYESQQTGGDDCNDVDPLVNPGAEEIDDGVDNNCDGRQPNDDNDLDGDGFVNWHDCNHEDSTIYPGAEEIVNDGIDQDCDGEDATRVTQVVFNEQGMVACMVMTTGDIECYDNADGSLLLRTKTMPGTDLSRDFRRRQLRLRPYRRRYSLLLGAYARATL